ncbi:MAG: DUF4397 domain-containing protein [Terriglobales bacterium]
MFRLLKASPLLLAIAALSLVTTSCNSSGSAKIRVIDVIPQSENLDIDINGTKITESLTDGLQDGSVYPAQGTSGAQYVSVASGTDTLEAFVTGTTTSPIIDDTSASLKGSIEYTVLLGGFLSNNPQVYLITDNNTAPATTSNQIEIRIINGSAISNNYKGIDVAVYESIAQPPSPQITGLGLGQASSYTTYPFESSYSIEVFLHGSTTPLFTFTPANFQTGEIMTLVIVDLASGGAVSTRPIVMVDVAGT